MVEFKTKISYAIGFVALFSLNQVVASTTLQDNYVVNTTDQPLTIKNEAGGTQATTVDAFGTATIPASWMGSGKQQYFQISTSTATNICVNNPDIKYGTKHNPGVTTTVLIASGNLTCTDEVVDQPIMPPQEPDNTSPPGDLSVYEPIITGLPFDINISHGQAFEISGAALIENVPDGENVVVSHLNLVDHHPAFSITKTGLNSPQTNFTVSTRQATPLLANTTYSFTIHAKSNHPSSETNPTYRTVNVHVGSDTGISNEIIPKTISAWVYDASGGNTTPGQFIDDINKFNDHSVKAENRITELHTYGSDMEIWGKGKILQMYYITNTHDLIKKTGVQETAGPENVLVYRNAVRNLRYVTPIIDGRTDVGYLKEFNDLSTAQAHDYADVVAQQVCLDPNIEGTQIDLEPLDFTKNAQVQFYLRLVQNFDGQHLRVCQGKRKFVSVFTFASKIIAGLNGPYGNDVRTLLSDKHFLVIDSLYDLPAASAINSTPDQYKNFVQAEVNQLVQALNIHPFKFKFGIPASCSFHECNDTGSGVPDNTQYVQYALEAINKADICSKYDNNNLFKGITLWAFDNETVTWAGKSYTIKPPHDNVRSLISESASDLVGCHLNDHVNNTEQLK